MKIRSRVLGTGMSVPDEVITNPQYEIDYLGQLAQSQKRSQLNALVTALSMAGSMAQFAPEVLDKIDPDRATEEVWDVLGAPAKVNRFYLSRLSVSLGLMRER